MGRGCQPSLTLKYAAGGGGRGKPSQDLDLAFLASSQGLFQVCVASVIDASHRCADVVSIGFTLEGCLSLSLQRKGISVSAGNTPVFHSFPAI